PAAPASRPKTAVPRLKAAVPRPAAPAPRASRPATPVRGPATTPVRGPATTVETTAAMRATVRGTTLDRLPSKRTQEVRRQPRARRLRAARAGAGGERTCVEYAARRPRRRPGACARRLRHGHRLPTRYDRGRSGRRWR